jgi:hypothetical protein
VGRGLVQYVGQFRCVGHQVRSAPDTRGMNRQAIVFELDPVAP